MRDERGRVLANIDGDFQRFVGIVHNTCLSPDTPIRTTMHHISRKQALYTTPHPYTLEALTWPP